MVLVLSRGGFCPEDRRQAELLVQLHREMEVAYCRLVTISTDNITLTNEYRTGVGAHWPFLSDAGRIVQKDLDIAEYTDPGNNPMFPHAIVLEPGLVVHKGYNGYWFFGRPTMEDLRQDLRAVTQKCRPDWDITKPEMKTAWKEGARICFIHMARPTPKRSGSRIKRQDLLSGCRMCDALDFCNVIFGELDLRRCDVFFQMLKRVGAGYGEHQRGLVEQPGK